MRRNLLTMVVGYMLLASSALAQTTAPGAPAPSAPADAGGLGSYWWVILVALLAAGAIWYFMRGRNRV